MAVATLTTKVDAKQAQDELNKLNKKMGDLDRKGGKLKLGASEESGGMKEKLAAGLGTLTNSFAAAGVAIGSFSAAVAAVVADVTNQRAARMDTAGKIDDLSDQGNALGLTGNEGIAAAMALKETLTAAGASPDAVNKMVANFAANQEKITDSDRAQLGISGMVAAESMLSLLKGYGGASSDQQKVIRELVGMDSGRMGTVFSAIKKGTSDEMVSDYQRRQRGYAATLPTAIGDVTGKVEMNLLEAQNRAIVNTVQDPARLLEDSKLEARKIIDASRYAGGETNLAYQMGAKAEQTWKDFKSWFGKTDETSKKQYEELKKIADNTKAAESGQQTQITAQ